MLMKILGKNIETDGLLRTVVMWSDWDVGGPMLDCPIPALAPFLDHLYVGT